MSGTGQLTNPRREENLFFYFLAKASTTLSIATTLRSWQNKEDIGFSQNKKGHRNAGSQILFFPNFNCMIVVFNKS